MEGYGSRPGQKRVRDHAEDAPETIEAEVSADFEIECPYNARRVKRSVADDVYVETDSPALLKPDGKTTEPLVPGLPVEFGVRPGKKWSELRRYKNAKCKPPSKYPIL
jgi:hypothetical protein